MRKLNLITHHTQLNSPLCMTEINFLLYFLINFNRKISSYSQTSKLALLAAVS